MLWTDPLCVPTEIGAQEEIHSMKSLEAQESSPCAAFGCLPSSRFLTILPLRDCERSWKAQVSRTCLGLWAFGSFCRLVSVSRKAVRSEPLDILGIDTFHSISFFKAQQSASWRPARAGGEECLRLPTGRLTRCLLEGKRSWRACSISSHEIILIAISIGKEIQEEFAHPDASILSLIHA